MVVSGLLISIVLIIVGTSLWRIHPFLVLLAVTLFYGLWVQIPMTKLVDLMQQGFGTTLGKIGLLILMGVLIGQFLEKSGGAVQLAQALLRITGLKHLPWALSTLGFIISIPVFVDAGFVLLQGLTKVLSKKAGVSILTTTTALAMGLMTSHCLIPPTPGPLAATGILQADMGLVLVYGICIGLLAQIPTVFYSQWIGRKIQIEHEELTTETIVTTPQIPSLSLSILPIAVPLLCIMAKSFWPSEGEPNLITSVIGFVGTPFIALGMGFLLSLSLPKKLEKTMFSGQGWVGDAFRESGDILLVTGAGGMFGFVLQASDLSQHLLEPTLMKGMGLWIPFAVAFLLKTIQGSSTVALLTTASLVAPLLPSLGIITPDATALTVIAMGAGAVGVSHVNDSYFWVVTKLSGLNVSTGLRSHSAASFVTGLTAMILCWLANTVLG